MEKNNIDQFENILRPEINKNVFGTLAIDLGSSTTVVVFQKENGQPPELLDLPPISRAIGEIPSLIWKSSEKEESYFIGQQIIDLNLINEKENNLSQDFKRWIGSKEIEPIYNSKITPEKAGEILIHSIWEKVSQKVNIKRLVLTAPVDTYREYRTWLVDVCNSLEVKEIALVDEPTAAAMGAGLEPGSTLLVLDFGGSTIDMSIVALEGGEGQASPIAQLVRFDGNNLEGKSTQVLRTAKVLGKSGLRLGGKDIDRWIFHHLLPEENPTNSILRKAEELKCELSNTNIKETLVITKKINNIQNEEKFLKLSKKGLEELLIEKGLLKSIEKLFKQTINSAKRNSFELKDLDSVVLVGGGSRIPLIKNYLSDICNSIPFLTPPPIEAIALGALHLTPGVQIKDVLNKGVSLRCWNKKNEKHIWHPLFLAGQTWPTNKPLEIILAASINSQLSIDLIIGEPQEEGSNEIIYTNGLPTLTTIESKDKIKKITNTIISIPVDPPGEIGQDCIKLIFNINDNCQLEVEGVDLRNNKEITKQNLGEIR
ncbi:putative DnaK-type molecular chaperone (HSP70 family) [Prochlorococcus marinus str. NATL1A]|uniref:Putative DnaK-type molecular chaperone (HSP70 family) n=1 Tax=Prochlorococcus marinus (strain NATL1A) TaxID=167555 RepID=A2C4H8_PROM1|nr:Hsp70 family protein [Prochlorococcus marinus]ABM76388.1 putative DnaK-type molecular chaperone (HSP70 family) [Prochlorococcus marinus str. NATL1A]